MTITGYDREVYTHVEVGLSIFSGEADAGIATVAVSKLMGLHFVPVTQENFDMAWAVDLFQPGHPGPCGGLAISRFPERFESWGAMVSRIRGKILYSNI